MVRIFGENFSSKFIKHHQKNFYLLFFEENDSFFCISFHTISEFGEVQYLLQSYYPGKLYKPADEYDVIWLEEQLKIYKTKKKEHDEFMLYNFSIFLLIVAPKLTITGV